MVVQRSWHRLPITFVGQPRIEFLHHLEQDSAGPNLVSRCIQMLSVRCRQFVAASLLLSVGPQSEFEKSEAFVSTERSDPGLSPLVSVGRVSCARACPEAQENFPLPVLERPVLLECLLDRIAVGGAPDFLRDRIAEAVIPTRLDGRAAAISIDVDFLDIEPVVLNSALRLKEHVSRRNSFRRSAGQE